MLCIADTEGYFLRVNSAFSRILGWTKLELLSRPFPDFIHPDDLPSSDRGSRKMFTSRYGWLPVQTDSTKTTSPDIDAISFINHFLGEIKKVDEPQPPALRIDWETARENSGNDEEILQAVIQESKVELPELLTGLKASLYTSDAREAKRFCHTIRSIGRMLGATTLSELASVCEQDAEKAKFEIIQDRLSDLQIETEAVVSEIENYLLNH